MKYVPDIMRNSASWNFVKNAPSWPAKTKWNGKDVKIDITSDQTLIYTWDDGTTAETYDVIANVEMTVEGHTFKGSSGIYSITSPGDDVIDSINKQLEEEIIPAAIADMRGVIIHFSEGYEVKRQRDKLFEEEKKMRIAEFLHRKYIIG